MSLEEATEANTKALLALNTNLTAILGGKTPAAATPAARPPGRPKSVTLDDVKAMAEKVRDQRDRPAAVALIKQHGADSLADLDKSKYAAFIAAAEVLLSAEPEIEPEEQTGDADL